MQKIYDVAIVGAGVVGTMLFSDLSRAGYSAVLIEKELDVSTGMSKANSGLVHAGFDAKPGTLKAILNVKGNKMYPSLCKRLGVKLKNTGAFVIGDNLDTVKDLYNRGMQNGVENLYILNRKELLSALPNIADNISYGLFAKDACIVDPYLLTICLAEEGVVNGGDVALDFQTTSILNKDGVFEIVGSKGVIFARKIINCAGAGYNDIAKLIGSEQYKTEFRRGEYYVLDNSEGNIVPSTVFPLPTKLGKGVLVTPTVDGNILVGPTSYESDYDTKTTDAGLADIRAKVGLMLNNVNLSKTIRVFAGVRVIVGDDFVIVPSKKVKDVYNIAGICSPGLSAAPAISEYVIKNLLGFEYKAKKGAVKIKPYIRLNELSISMQNKLIKQNPNYGKIVCKCEGISVGEIIDAINRPIRPQTMDGIKRRIRAGMGRCQGGFCSDKVARILAKENNVPIESIVKERKGGYYLLGDIHKGGK